MAFLKKRQSVPMRRAGRSCSRIKRSTSTAGSRKNAAASSSVNTSPVGPFLANVADLSWRTIGFAFIRGIARFSFFLRGMAALLEIGRLVDWQAASL
jgi:hypothetical protein